MDSPLITLALVAALIAGCAAQPSHDGNLGGESQADIGTPFDPSMASTLTLSHCHQMGVDVEVEANAVQARLPEGFQTVTMLTPGFALVLVDVQQCEHARYGNNSVHQLDFARIHAAVVPPQELRMLGDEGYYTFAWDVLVSDDGLRQWLAASLADVQGGTAQLAHVPPSYNVEAAFDALGTVRFAAFDTNNLGTLDERFAQFSLGPEGALNVWSGRMIRENVTSGGGGAIAFPTDSWVALAAQTPFPPAWTAEVRFENSTVQPVG